MTYTFTVSVGDRSCPNSCPMCISKMTPYLPEASPAFLDAARFEKATRYAIADGCKNVLFTSKGETVLFQEEITRYLHLLSKHQSMFATVEIQTSGAGLNDALERNALVWKDMGMNCISLSVFTMDDEKNRAMFHNPKMPSPHDSIRAIQRAGMMTRLSFIPLKSCVNTVDGLMSFVDSARYNGVDRVTLRKIGYATSNGERERAYANENVLPDEFWAGVENRLGTPVLENGFMKMYTVGKTTVSVVDCLKGDARSLIYYGRAGIFATSWDNPEGTRIF